MTEIAGKLLPWSARHGRKHLPWQNPATAYRVWVSEIMLQQTQVSTVIPYFERFINTFPSVQKLAEAHLDEVLKHWAGLGYYARARNLHKAAGMMQAQNGGEVPADLEQLMALPGIGRSTAGAILSLAHRQVAPILDGNVKRVLSRVYQVEGWSGQSATLKRLWSLAQQQTPEDSTAHYNQAMMDLGSLVCRRSKPLCESCPLTSLCRSYRHGTQVLFPQPKPRKSRPHKHCWMLIHTCNDHVLLQQRPAQGIWGGLWSLPELQDLKDLKAWQYRVLGDDREADELSENRLKHRFSHFDLSISTAVITVSDSVFQHNNWAVHEENSMQWVARKELKNYGLPAPVLKILTG